MNGQRDRQNGRVTLALPGSAPMPAVGELQTQRPKNWCGARGEFGAQARPGTRTFERHRRPFLERGRRSCLNQLRRKKNAAVGERSGLCKQWPCGWSMGPTFSNDASSTCAGSPAIARPAAALRAGAKSTELQPRQKKIILPPKLLGEGGGEAGRSWAAAEPTCPRVPYGAAYRAICHRRLDHRRRDPTRFSYQYRVSPKSKIRLWLQLNFKKYARVHICARSGDILSRIVLYPHSWYKQNT